MKSLTLVVALLSSWSAMVAAQDHNCLCQFSSGAFNQANTRNCCDQIGGIKDCGSHKQCCAQPGDFLLPQEFNGCCHDLDVTGGYAVCWDLNPKDIVARKVLAINCMVALASRQELQTHKPRSTLARGILIKKEPLSSAPSPEPFPQLDEFPLILGKTQCIFCIGNERYSYEQRTCAFKRVSHMRVYTPTYPSNIQLCSKSVVDGTIIGTAPYMILVWYAMSASG